LDSRLAGFPRITPNFPLERRKRDIHIKAWGSAPQGYQNQKNVSAESAIHFRHTSWISAN
jgi:hypothetical protein